MGKRKEPRWNKTEEPAILFVAGATSFIFVALASAIISEYLVWIIFMLGFLMVVLWFLWQAVNILWASYLSKIQDDNLRDK